MHLPIGKEKNHMSKRCYHIWRVLPVGQSYELFNRSFTQICMFCETIKNEDTKEEFEENQDDINILENIDDNKVVTPKTRRGC